MAHITFHGYVGRQMIWVDCLVEVIYMARRTLCWCSGITIGMTLQAIDLCMGARQRESGIVVIKCIICAAVRVTGKTGWTAVVVACNTNMVIVCLRINMTGYASIFLIIRWIGMAFRTGSP